MQIKRACAGNFKAYMKLPPEDRDSNIASMRYISQLASQANVNIDTWDTKVFTDKSTKLLFKDRGDINKAFFEEIDRLAAAENAPTVAADGTSIPAEPPKPKIPDDILKKVADVEKRKTSDLIRKHESDYEVYVHSAIDYSKQSETQLQRAATAASEIRRLKDNDGKFFQKEIEAVIAGAWNLHGVTGDKLEFTTKADVILHHKNTRAGIDIKLNMGKYKASFNLHNATLLVTGFERNIKAKSHIHPHIAANSGGICWGSANEQAIKGLAKFTISQPMALLYTILCSYNQDSPYVAIEHFQEVVGTPEDNLAAEEMDKAMAPARARFAGIDNIVPDLNMWARQPSAVQPDVVQPAPVFPAAEPVAAPMTGLPPVEEVLPSTLDTMRTIAASVGPISSGDVITIGGSNTTGQFVAIPVQDSTEDEIAF